MGKRKVKSLEHPPYCVEHDEELSLVIDSDGKLRWKCPYFNCGVREAATRRDFVAAWNALSGLSTKVAGLVEDEEQRLIEGVGG